MIRLTDVSKTFDEGHSYAVQNLSLEVRDGETLVLLGSSGCGKTTTLKMVNGLVEPTSGTVAVNGLSVTQHDVLSLCRAVGYVAGWPGFSEPWGHDFSPLKCGPRQRHLQRDRIETPR